MTFEKVSNSDKPMHGQRKLILCGFPVEAQPRFKTLLKMIQMKDLPIVWAGDDDKEMTLSDIFKMEANRGEGTASSLPRAIIVSGILEQELHYLMSACRQTKMKPALWAVVTPVSEKWTLKELIEELEAERVAMANMKKGNRS